MMGWRGIGREREEWNYSTTEYFAAPAVFFLFPSCLPSVHLPLPPPPPRENRKEGTKGTKGRNEGTKEGRNGRWGEGRKENPKIQKNRKSQNSQTICVISELLNFEFRLPNCGFSDFQIFEFPGPRGGGARAPGTGIRYATGKPDR